MHPHINPAAIKHLPALLIVMIKELIFFSKFIIILSLYSIQVIFNSLASKRVLKFIFKPISLPVSHVSTKIINLVDPPTPQQIAAIDLIELAYNELRAKKVRTVITVGGMSLGFGLIIFLLSIGYGLEKVVVSRVASLTEIKQADVIVGQTSNLAISDEVIDSIQKINQVTEVFPQISTVAKISFNNSVADAVAYGVTTSFLEQSAIQPNHGEIFKDEIYAALPKSNPAAEASPDQATDSGEVAGTNIEQLSQIALGQEINKIRYSLLPLIWQSVYDSPTATANLLGYTQRQVGNQEAGEVWGDPYPETGSKIQAVDENQRRYQSWIQDTFPLWEKKTCDIARPDCVDGNYIALKTNSAQTTSHGFIKQDQVNLERYQITIEKRELSQGKKVEDIQFGLTTNTLIKLHSQPESTSFLAGLATKNDTDTVEFISGELVLGSYYYSENDLGNVAQDSRGNRLGYWIRAEYPVWQQIECGSDCENYYLPLLDDNNKQKKQLAFIRADDATLLNPVRKFELLNREGQVLGETTEGGALITATESGVMSQLINQFPDSTNSANFSSTRSSDATLSATIAGQLEDDLDWALIASQAGIIKPKEAEILPIPSSIKKVAIVNSAFLSMLGITAEEALGKNFTTKYLFDGQLFGQNDYLAESEEIEYKIIGVLPDTKTPFFYVPFSDLQSFSLTEYSQLKIMVDETAQLAKVRTDIEAMGFKTSSVVDTVERINSLFATLRVALLILGMVALGVAALGMFNTLTVSLLEKTRQVGLMKAMGMKSHEVKRLFLAESVIMGVSGGLMGLMMAFLAGKAVSAVLSSLAIANGVGVLDVAHIPPALALTVMLFSFLIGVGTGWYPSHRATRISALNALRYE